MILYLSVIFISMGLIAGFNIIFNSAWHNLAVWQIIVAVVVGVLLEIVIEGIFAFIISRMPNKFFKHESKLFNISKKEQKFYEKIGIRKWKDKVLELGRLNHFSKKRLLEPENNEYLNKFLIECYKGIVIHIFGIVFGCLLVVILPLKLWLKISLPIILVNTILNLMSIFILRYNIPKLRTMIKYNQRHKNKD